MNLFIRKINNCFWVKFAYQIRNLTLKGQQLNCCHGARFTNVISRTIQIRWNIRLDVI